MKKITSTENVHQLYKNAYVLQTIKDIELQLDSNGFTILAKKKNYLFIEFDHFKG